jgi:hypothetical protein
MLTYRSLGRCILLVMDIVRQRVMLSMLRGIECCAMGWWSELLGELVLFIYVLGYRLSILCAHRITHVD